MIGAPRLRDRELLVARGGRDHGGAQHLADLDRGKPDAAAGAVHQQHFARLQPAAIDQRVIRGAVAGEKRRAFGIVEGRRQRHELRRRRHGLIAIGAVPHLDDDPVADRDALGAVDLDHIAGRFHARRERQRRLELILARRHQDVRKIDPGGMDGDAHLPRRQRRGGKRFQAQALGRAEFAADDGSRHQAASRFQAQQRLADQRHAVVAEIHVGLVDEDRRRAEAAARHHLLRVGLELVLDRLLADAFEEL